MGTFAKEIFPINIEDEMKQSYLDYAMSVIVGRALPDVRDGLKPVHRRVLFAMNELNNVWNKPYKKSARIVGDVIGKYHPHGDSAVYDTIVRMAQPFSLRYMLVDGQGNFGSIDGDNAAAMRYTEIRMQKISHELIADIDKETVDFIPNYDESEYEPTVFPTRIPNLLVNGTSGIAVGMATNIPPHNLKEVVNGCLAVLNQPQISIEELMQFIPGPDFPTAGLINGANGIVEAYKTGRGRIYMRACCHIEDRESSDRQRIVITELPYQVNKARLLEKIAELVKEKKLDGISELRDESDKDGIRVVVELKRGETGEVILNNLYKQTQLQSVFGINMVALVDGEPRLLNLKQLIEFFLNHRREVVTRRTLFDVRKARERAHLLEGLAVALINIDDIIRVIKGAKSTQDAKQGLNEAVWQAGTVAEMAEAGEHSVEKGLQTDNTYILSTEQIQAILELRLHRLTGLEQDKIVGEFKEILTKITALQEILDSSERLTEVIREELTTILDTYQDARRTQILRNRLDLSLEDLITEEDMVITLSREGYVKSQAVSLYQAQRRGGKGKSATQMKNEDIIDKLFVASTHDTILCFSSRGKVYWLKVYDLPQASRVARGKPIVNLLPLEEGETISTILPVREFSAEQYIVMATSQGTIKKTALTDFSRPRANGIIAIGLEEDDHLISADITTGDQDIMLFSRYGKAVRFSETHVRAVGRTAKGVRGIRLTEKDDRVMSLIINNGGTILTATVNGFGKRTEVTEFASKGRGIQGVIAIKTSDRNGEVVGAVQVNDDDDIFLITDQGTLVRTGVGGISVVSRNTQGVNLISLAKDEQLVGIEPVVELGGDDDDSDEALDENSEETSNIDENEVAQ